MFDSKQNHWPPPPLHNIRMLPKKTLSNIFSLDEYFVKLFLIITNVLVTWKYLKKTEKVTKDFNKQWATWIILWVSWKNYLKINWKKKKVEWFHWKNGIPKDILCSGLFNFLNNLLIEKDVENWIVSESELETFYNNVNLIFSCFLCFPSDCLILSAHTRVKKWINHFKNFYRRN